MSIDLSDEMGKLLITQ